MNISVFLKGKNVLLHNTREVKYFMNSSKMPTVSLKLKKSEDSHVDHLPALTMELISLILLKKVVIEWANSILLHGFLARV